MRAKYIRSSWIDQNSSFMEEGRYFMVNTRGVFRTQSNIYDGGFLQK